MLTRYYDSILKPFDVFGTFSLFDEPYHSLWNSKTRKIDSSYRVNSTEKGLALSLDLPGVKSKDLSVKLSGRTIVVTGKLRGEEFQYSYSLTKEYDTEGVEATFEDGVLTIFFKKSELSSKTIEIQVK